MRVNEGGLWKGGMDDRGGSASVTEEGSARVKDGRECVIKGG